MATKPVDEKAIFNVARNIESPEALSAYLNQVCGGDTQTRQRIVDLLRVHAQEQSFLESPPPGIDATLDTPTISERPGTQIGPFKLMEQIGEGGFGLVFVAEQQRPVRRKVALKIIKPGMDSKDVIARFEAERQALAMMDHPNIAKVLDAGTTDSGRPFFVMELVRGIPITEYCDRKRLTTNARLKLFVTVCQAIQHAHQKGVIHRDVKPSNVLVTEHDGTPMSKVIDFGVAKAINQRLTERTIYTRHQQLVGTPLYMSPEQAELSAMDVDTRTDIYSLGVLLYELLTGVTPFDRQRLHEAAFDEMRRIIREEEPMRPSLRISTLGDSAGTVSECRNSEPKKLSHALRGELDWIVMKAIEKDRTRRYETALGLGLDVQRFLSQEAVHACPPSVGYHARKVFRRHKTAVAFGLSAIVLLSAGIIGTASGWLAERTARRVAVTRAREASDAKEKEEQLRIVADSQRRKAEYGQYVIQIQVAAAHLELGNNFPARATLEETLPQYRNWEWGYLAQRAWAPPTIVKPPQRLVRNPESTAADFWASAPASTILPLQSDRSSIESISFSHDGAHAATTLGNGSLRIRDVRTGNEVWTSPVFGAVIPSVAVSHKDSRIACGGQDGEIWVWDLNKEKSLWNKRGVNGLSAGRLWFSPDDSRLVVAYFDGHVGVWDVETGQLVAPFFQKTKSSVWSIQFQGSGEPGTKVIAASVDGSVRVWDLDTGQKAERPRFAPHHQGSDMMAHAISPDRNTVAAGYYDGAVMIWKLAEPDECDYLDTGSDRITELLFSEDGSCLFVVTGSTQVTVFDVATKTQVNNFTDPRPNYKVALSPDSERFATLAYDGRCSIWAPVRPMTQQRRRLINAHDDIVLQAAFSPDGKRIVTASYDKTARVWDTFTRELIAEFPGHQHEVLKAEFDRRGRYVASISSRGNVRVWDPETGDELFYHPAESEGFLEAAATDRGLRGNMLDFSAVVAASPFAHHSDRMVVNGPHGMVVLDSRDGTEHFKFEYAGLAQRDRPRAGWATIGPNDKRVAVITDGRTDPGKGRTSPVLHLWDLDTGKRLFALKGHKRHPFWVKFSPDGSKIVTGAMENAAIIWDAKTGKELWRLDEHRASRVIACFSPDGKRVATAANDEAIVWDVATGAHLSSYDAPFRYFNNIEFSPDGDRVLSTFDSGDAVCIWDPTKAEAREFVRLTGEGRLLYATWSPNGQQILTCWDDGSVRLFEAISWDSTQPADISIEQRVRQWHSDRAIQ